MKCTIIDDEPFALELIKDYVRKTPFLELGECFTNPFKALSYLSKERPDLIFLDINMPELSGIQLLKSLISPPPVIFTTAYPEFGAESYEFNAVDYLLKPVKYERFLKAVGKASSIAGSADKENTSHEPLSGKNEYLYIKSGTRLVKVKTNDILYVEAAGNYMTFHTSDKKILSLMNIQEALDMLAEQEFVRIHKSYLVSLRNIDAIEKHDVIIKGKPIPIGITYREKFLSMLPKNNNY
jgi:DNA-binding LytR/AlgR family response regulator